MSDPIDILAIAAERRRAAWFCAKYLMVTRAPEPQIAQAWAESEAAAADYHRALRVLGEIEAQ